MDAAHKEKEHGKEAITLDAAATKGKNKPKIPGQDVTIAEVNKSTYQLELEDFVACVRTGREPFCNGEIGLRSAAAALLANEAMEKGERIEFKESLYEV
jgi:predicted dehydrogenase